MCVDMKMPTKNLSYGLSALEEKIKQEEFVRKIKILLNMHIYGTLAQPSQ
jgi:hypothetical protein